MFNAHVPARRLLWLFVPFLAAASLACFEVANEPEEFNPAGTEHTVTLNIEAFGCVIPFGCGPVDWEATFEILEGPNAGLTSEDPLDGICSPCDGGFLDEEANWTYQSNGLPGTDVIRACVTFDPGSEFEDEQCTGDIDEDPHPLKTWVAVEEPEELPDLIIEKSCPNGAGDGDADFNIVVSQLVTAFAADSLDCGEPMVVEDLEPGTYTIREFITGPNANDFLTAIVCATADGQTVTPGLQAEVEVEDGADTECAVINVFDPPGDPADPTDPSDPSTPTIIVPIDLFNNNTNALNNNNTNDNNNENTNTQEQSNQQEQTNDNNQTTSVNSSPSVVIDFDD